MVVASTNHHDPRRLEAIDYLAQLTDRLRHAVDLQSPALADLVRSCAQAFQDLQQVYALESMPTRDSDAEDRHALLTRLGALNANTTACVRSLEKVLGETEQRLQLLRTQQRAARGYRNCLQRNW